jgi:hypothetical protein
MWADNRSNFQTIILDWDREIVGVRKLFIRGTDWEEGSADRGIWKKGILDEEDCGNDVL